MTILSVVMLLAAGSLLLVGSALLDAWMTDQYGDDDEEHNYD